MKTRMKIVVRTLTLSMVMLAAGCVVEPVGPGPGYYHHCGYYHCR
jgi:hypothetical protein